MNEISKILGEELKKRQRNNPSYSLRSFAAFLEVSPAALSQMISGKRGASLKKLNHLMSKLGLTPKQQLKLLNVGDTVERKTKLLEEDQFKLISDWYHYAILSLGELSENSADTRWIAKRLNIRLSDANDAFSRLKRLDLIEVQGDKFWQKVAPLSTTRDVPSDSIRNYHKGILGLAQNKIEAVAVDKREFSSITMAINSKKIQKAKMLTQKYKEEMLSLLEKGKRDEVYQLSIQLFPLSSNK